MTTAATHSDPLTLMQADRDQLTLLLRGLAARLDELDRSLADLAWRGRGSQIGVALGEWLCERTALEAERERLGGRLAVLANQLTTLDNRLSDTGSIEVTPPRGSASARTAAIPVSAQACAPSAGRTWHADRLRRPDSLGVVDQQLAVAWNHTEPTVLGVNPTILST